jgi:hypothetical protein
LGHWPQGIDAIILNFERRRRHFPEIHQGSSAQACLRHAVRRISRAESHAQIAPGREQLAVWDFWRGFARARARAEFSLGYRYL